MPANIAQTTARYNLVQDLVSLFRVVDLLDSDGNYRGFATYEGDPKDGPLTRSLWIWDSESESYFYGGE